MTRKIKSTLSETEAKKPSMTLSTAVYRELRAEVLSGRLKPGVKLRAEDLRKRFNIASSPIREALNRLVSEGFVALEDQKGFRVAPVSESDLHELVLARCAIDGAAISESIRRFDVPWEEGLVLALHRLSRASRQADEQLPAGEMSWETLHREFHCALVSGCGSRWTRRISEQLFDAAERYRLLAAQQISERNELAEHQAIVEACLSRRPADAVDLLQRHYGMTFAVIMGSPAAPAAPAN
jgi:DNA-binding GntR family transcriptional regulator